MNLWRRQPKSQSQKAPVIAGSIAYYNLTDWWLSSFSEDERTYIARSYQPWGARPYSLIEGAFRYSALSVAAHLSEITRYLRQPQDLYLIRRILKKAEQEAMRQGDLEALDSVYKAMIDALAHACRHWDYYWSLRLRKTRWPNGRRARIQDLM